MVPDPEKTLAEGAIAPWAKAGEVTDAKVLRAGCSHPGKRVGVSMDVPYGAAASFHEALMHGTGERAIAMGWGEDVKTFKIGKAIRWARAAAPRLYQTTESEFSRQRIRHT